MGLRHSVTVSDSADSIFDLTKCPSFSGLFVEKSEVLRGSFAEVLLATVSRSV